jgi:hypothetical protein
VKTRFQSLPFKCNLYRYVEASLAQIFAVCDAAGHNLAGGLYKVNQVDP